MCRMRWNCKRKGCFNQKKRLHFSKIADCFPGRIYPTDIDWAVEVNSHLLIVEWKTEWDGRELPKGQRLMFERMTRQGPRIIGLACVGDNHIRDVSSLTWCILGKFTSWIPTDKENFRLVLKNWVTWVQQQGDIQHQKPLIIGRDYLNTFSLKREQQSVERNRILGILSKE